MSKEYIILQRDCKKETPITLNLNKETDEWDLLRMKAAQIDPSSVSAVHIGPKTVFEYYEALDFSSKPFRVVNDSDQVKVQPFGCYTLDTWRGTFKSFVIMTLDYYNKTYGIRYCDSNTQCRTNEYCLCPNGQEHPSWCPQSKRRCMNWNKFTFESPIPILDTDDVYVKCLEEQMKLYANNNKVKYDIVKEFSRKCATDKLKTIEQFTASYSLNNMIIGILFFLLIICLLKI